MSQPGGPRRRCRRSPGLRWPPHLPRTRGPARPASDRCAIRRTAEIVSRINGNSGTAMPSAVQNPARPGNTVQPSTNSATRAAGIRLRRKLSKTFQRSTSERTLRRRSTWPEPGGVSGGAAGVVRNSHGSNCQSPRTQRCSRLANELYRAGKSSMTSISLTSAQRAKFPSMRSWLRM